MTDNLKDGNTVCIKAKIINTQINESGYQVVRLGLGGFTFCNIIKNDLHILGLSSDDLVQSESGHALQPELRGLAEIEAGDRVVINNKYLAVVLSFAGTSASVIVDGETSRRLIGKSHLRLATLKDLSVLPSLPKDQKIKRLQEKIASLEASTRVAINPPSETEPQRPTKTVHFQEPAQRPKRQRHIQPSVRSSHLAPVRSADFPAGTQDEDSDVTID